MKPMLKPPATKHLKLECDERLSNFAFNCNLRRYTMGLCALSPTQDSTVMACPGLNKGQVRVELYDLGQTKFISAHDSDLARGDIENEHEHFTNVESTH